MNRKELEVLFGIVIAASLLVLAVSSVRDRTIREQQPQDGPAEVQQVEQLPAGQLPAVDAPTVPPDAILANPGYRPRPEKTEGFLKTLRRPTLREANPDLFRGARGPPRAKEPILLYRALYDAHRLRFGTDWKVGSQGIGDCFVAGTMVTLADGSHKAIESVEIGELVCPGMGGNPYEVVDTIRKPYSGELLTVTAGKRSVVCTPDHQFLQLTDSGTFAWIAASDLKPGESVQTYRSGSRWILPAKITDIERSKPVKCDVYCLTVHAPESMASFIANEFAVHNCVSWGWAHGADIHLAVLWKLGVSSEWKPAATEAIYGGSRVEAEGVSFGGWSDGSYGGSAAKWVRDWGILYRQPYGDVDLTTYSSKRAKDWGAYGCGGQKDAGKLDDVAKKHPVRHVALVTTFDDAAAAIASGYPVPVCSNQGFAKVRDKDGFARASGSWAHCFLPGTMFSTLIPKPCEEVMQGDLVVTHAGHLMPADQVIKSQYSGPITTIRATGCLDVSATNGHPILIYRPMDSASANPQAKPDVDFVTYAGGSYKSLAKKKSEYDKSQPIWVAIEDVRRGDYLLTPRRLKRHPYPVPEWVYSPRSKQRPPLLVDSDVAFLLGNYVANGDAVPAHKIRITMPLNAPYLPRLASACQKLGLEFTAKDESGWTRFVVYDATVANSFRQWCGTTSETKHVPEFMYGDGWDWKAFLDGYAAGDGTRLLNLSTERYRTTSVSQSLSFQVWQMAVDLGMYPIMTKINADRPGVYENAKDSYGVEFGECQIRKSTRYWQDYYCMPVRESTPGNYEGMVYNLEVPGDETYLANGIVAHNCMCFVAVRYEPRPGLLCLNSWGTSWISGPKYPDDQPDGSFWVDAETATRMLRGRDSFAVSGIEGFPYRNLDNADWVRLVPRNGSVVESFVLAP